MRALLPESLWREVRGLLPDRPASPKGGRPRVPDRACLAALVYLLREGGSYRRLPCRELGCGSPGTVRRRLAEWSRDGLWEKVHRKLLGHLGRAGAVDVSTVVADSASTRAVKGGSTPAPARPTAAKKAASGTC